VKTDNAIIAGIAIKVHASEIQRAGKLSRSRSTDKPTPREVSGVVKLRGNSLRAISRWYVIKKERERERENIDYQWRPRRSAIRRGDSRAREPITDAGSCEISKFKGGEQRARVMNDAIVGARMSWRG